MAASVAPTARSSENPTIGSHDYFALLHAVEERHWWSLGVRDIADVMIRRHFDDPTGLDVLDAGCGTGISLDWLSQYSAPKPVVGLDVSEHALAFSRSRGHTEVQQGSVTDLPFDDASFDLVVCNDVIQHVPDDQRALEEMYRVLRPNGCLNVRTNTKLGIDTDKAAASDDYRMYTHEELIEKLAGAGFRVGQITHVNVLLGTLTLVKRYFAERKETTYDDRGLPIRLLPDHLFWINGLLHRLMRAEARYFRKPTRSLRYGSAILFNAIKPT